MSFSILFSTKMNMFQLMIIVLLVCSPLCHQASASPLDYEPARSSDESDSGRKLVKETDFLTKVEEDSEDQALNDLIRNARERKVILNFWSYTLEFNDLKMVKLRSQALKSTEKCCRAWFERARCTTRCRSMRTSSISIWATMSPITRRDSFRADRRRERCRPERKRPRVGNCRARLALKWTSGSVGKRSINQSNWTHLR